MNRKLSLPLAALVLTVLTGGCSVLDAIAEGPKPLSVHVPLVQVSGATAQRMEEFLVPGATPASPRLQDRCAAGEDVRHRFPTRYAAVEVRPGSISVSGEQVASLDGWALRPNEVLGMLILPLYHRMQELADAHKSAATLGRCWPLFEGRVLLLVHPDTPYALTSRVLYSLGQAQFGEMSYAVADPSTLQSARQTPPAPPFTPRPAVLPQGPLASLTAADERSDRRCHDWAMLTLEPQGALMALYEPGPGHPDGDEAKAGPTAIAALPGGGLDRTTLEEWLTARRMTASGARREVEVFPTVAPGLETSFRTLAEMQSTLVSTLGADTVVLSMGGEYPDASQPSPDQAIFNDRGQSSSLGADQWVAVLRSSLPPIGPRDDKCGGRYRWSFPP